jgi:hypothetical protein
MVSTSDFESGDMSSILIGTYCLITAKKLKIQGKGEGAIPSRGHIYTLIVQ